MFDLSNDLIIRVLIFLVIFAMTIQILRKTLFQDNKAISGIIALTIALMGAFYISYSQLEFIIQTYGIGGILILIFVPFLIAFFFIYSSNITGVLRKMFWIFYGIVTFVILQNNNTFSSETLTGISLLIIFLTIGIILLDKSIQSQFNTIKNLKK